MTNIRNSRKISFFENAKSNTPKGDPVEFSSYLQEIQNGKWRKEVENYQSDPDSKKKKLIPAFTISGVFEIRNKEGLLEHSGILAIDIDDNPENKTLEFVLLKAQLGEDPRIIAAHYSLGGFGIVAYIKINPERHAECFAEAREYFKTEHGATIDESGKDTSRMRFVSFDPDFEIRKPTPEWQGKDLPKKDSATPKAIHIEPGTYNDGTGLLRALIGHFDRAQDGEKYTILNRTAFTIGGHIAGGTIDEAQAAQELEAAVHQKPNIDSICDALNTIKDGIKDGKSDPIQPRPYDPGSRNNGFSTGSQKDPEPKKMEELAEFKDFDQLPAIFQEILEPIDQEDREMATQALITIFSSLLEGITGFYRGSKSHPNEYLWVVGQSGSGKGLINSLMKILKPINRSIDDDRIRTRSEHRIKEREFKKANNIWEKGESIGGAPEEPKQPPAPYLQVPGDISTSALCTMAKDRQEGILIFQSESDTIGKGKGSEWMDISTNLRLGFGHEPITQARKNQEPERCEEPRITLILTSTPGQISSIVESTENGLFSRITWYRLTGRKKFTSKTTLPDGFPGEEHQQIAFLIWQFWREHKATLKLSESQLTKIDEKYEPEEVEGIKLQGDSWVGTNRRLAEKTYRWAMTLEAITRFEEGDSNPNNAWIRPEIFDLALKLSDTIRTHAIHTFEEFNPKTKEEIKQRILALHKAGMGVTEIASITGVSRQTIYNYLNTA